MARKQSLCGLQGPLNMIYMMNVMCAFARVVGVLCDKNHNPFSAHGSKKVAHHWTNNISYNFKISANKQADFCRIGPKICMESVTKSPQKSLLYIL